MKSKKKEIVECAIHLNWLMRLSDVAFSKYLSNKFYLHALCLKKSNEAVYKYIIEKAPVWPDYLQPDMINLLNHYDIWFTQFEDFRAKKEFELNESFVFYHLDEQSAYPKAAVQKIMTFFNDLTDAKMQ
jgi:hypothetical protein